MRRARQGLELHRRGVHGTHAHVAPAHALLDQRGRAHDHRRGDLDRLQDEATIGGRPVWILPNPSGLNAHYKPADFARLYKQAYEFALGS